MHEMPHSAADMTVPTNMTPYKSMILRTTGLSRGGAAAVVLDMVRNEQNTKSAVQRHYAAPLCRFIEGPVERRDSSESAPCGRLMSSRSRPYRCRNVR